MKKKILALIGVAVLAFGAVACGENTGNSDTNDTEVVTPVDDADNDNADTDNSQDENPGEVDNSGETSGGENTAVTDITSAVDAYTAFWNNYAESDKFAVVGGDYNNYVDGAPGACDISDINTLTNQFYIPEAVAGSVDDMATLVHMMNANTYTGVIVHTTAPDGFADALKDNITGVDWVCGFPDRLIIADLSDGYFAYAFGEASIMNDYVAKLQSTFPSANILHDVDLTK